MRRQTSVSITAISLFMVAAPLFLPAGAARPAVDDACAAPPPARGEALPTDTRLLQKVTVHANLQKLSDLLTWLSKTTGVTLLARMEVEDERVTVWAEGQPLIEFMRDLRHLHRWYWSRSKQEGQWVYSLWQDAQSRAREEADLQRLAMEQQRAFAENLQARVRALGASDAELKRLGRDDPYLVVQMKHPVVRGAYQLFASLSPDQQAQLTEGRAPSRYGSYGEILNAFPRESKTADPYFNDREWTGQFEPRGDIVSLSYTEMTEAQRAMLRDLLSGAAARLRFDAEQERQRYPGDSQYHPLDWQAQHVGSADPATATLTFFRWGDPNGQALCARVDFQTGGRDWVIYSNIAGPPGLYKDTVQNNGVGHVPGSSPEVERLLAGVVPPPAKAPEAAPPPPASPPDPVLDAPLSFTWLLPLRDYLREKRYQFQTAEVMAALHQAIRRPMVLDGLPRGLEQKKAEGPVFRWQKRSRRELLHRFFPGWPYHVREGTLFLEDPERVKTRLHQIPPAVERYLAAMKAPFTLDDIALIARSLTPWQIVKLHEFLPNGAIDQTLAAQELLQLYGELSPEQRATLPRGLAFAGLTPPQQALFLRSAQRQRAFTEPWRFQRGGLQMALGPSPIKDDGRGGPARNVSRALFRLRFDEEDSQSFPIDLFPPSRLHQGGPALAELVGRPFPFDAPTWHDPSTGEAGGGWKPARTDPRLRHKPLVIVFGWPFVQPYAGTAPPPATVDLARALAARLRGTGVTVVHIEIGPPPPEGAASPAAASSSPLLLLHERGDVNGQPFDSAGQGWFLSQSPTVFLVGGDEVIRGVIEGRQVWDAAAIEQAARRLVHAPGPVTKATR
jgi:hypothetical protein